MKIDKSAYGEDYNKERNDKLVKIASVAVCLLLIFVIDMKKTPSPPLDISTGIAYNKYDRLEKVHPSALFFDKVPVYL